MHAGQEKLVWGGNSEMAARRLLDGLPARLGPLWGRWRVLDYGDPIPGAPLSAGMVRRKIGTEGYAFEIAIKHNAVLFSLITRLTKDGRWFYHEMNYSGKSPYFKTKKEVMTHALSRLENHIEQYAKAA